MTTAELRTEEVQIQKRIAYYLDLASMWGAIVILDEAEVYLKQRKAGTFVHNALVSGMSAALRCCAGLVAEQDSVLEYTGVLSWSAIHIRHSKRRKDKTRGIK